MTKFQAINQRSTPGPLTPISGNRNQCHASSQRASSRQASYFRRRRQYGAISPQVVISPRPLEEANKPNRSIENCFGVNHPVETIQSYGAETRRLQPLRDKKILTSVERPAKKKCPALDSHSNKSSDVDEGIDSSSEASDGNDFDYVADCTHPRASNGQFIRRENRSKPTAISSRVPSWVSSKSMIEHVHTMPEASPSSSPDPRHPTLPATCCTSLSASTSSAGKWQQELRTKGFAELSQVTVPEFISLWQNLENKRARNAVSCHRSCCNENGKQVQHETMKETSHQVAGLTSGRTIKIERLPETRPKMPFKRQIEETSLDLVTTEVRKNVRGSMSQVDTTPSSRPRKRQQVEKESMQRETPPGIPSPPSDKDRPMSTPFSRETGQNIETCGNAMIQADLARDSPLNQAGRPNPKVPHSAPETAPEHLIHESPAVEKPRLKLSNLVCLNQRPSECAGSMPSSRSEVKLTQDRDSEDLYHIGRNVFHTGNSLRTCESGQTFCEKKAKSRSMDIHSVCRDRRSNSSHNVATSGQTHEPHKRVNRAEAGTDSMINSRVSQRAGSSSTAPSQSTIQKAGARSPKHCRKRKFRYQDHGKRHRKQSTIAAHNFYRPLSGPNNIPITFVRMKHTTINDNSGEHLKSATKSPKLLAKPRAEQQPALSSSSLFTPEERPQSPKESPIRNLRDSRGMLDTNLPPTPPVCSPSAVQQEASDSSNDLAKRYPSSRDGHQSSQSRLPSNDREEERSSSCIPSVSSRRRRHQSRVAEAVENPHPIISETDVLRSQETESNVDRAAALADAVARPTRVVQSISTAFRTNSPNPPFNQIPSSPPTSPPPIPTEPPAARPPRRRKRLSAAEKRLKCPELSADVPQYLRLSDEGIIRVGKLVNWYARHKEAPYAYQWSGGCIYPEYGHLIEMKDEEGVPMFAWHEKVRLIRGNY